MFFCVVGTLLKGGGGRCFGCYGLGGLVTLVLFSGSMSVEVFNVGGWLTHGDLALETDVDFLLLLSIVWFLLGLGESGLGFVLGVLLLFGLLLLKNLLMLVMVVLESLV